MRMAGERSFCQTPDLAATTKYNNDNDNVGGEVNRLLGGVFIVK